MKKEIIFCKKCLYSSSHPLGLTFNDKGICSGCEIHQEKYDLNWEKRFQKLVKITKQYRSKKKIIMIVLFLSLVGANLILF